MKRTNVATTMIAPALLCALIATPGWSEQPVPPGRTVLENRTSVPLDLSTGRPLIDVMINGHSFRMILDTGAQISLLDQSVVDELGIESRGTEELTSPMQGGTPMTAHHVVLPELVIGDAHFEQVPALSWEGALGLSGIRGVLSFTVFHELTATIDFPASNLTVTTQRMQGKQLDASFSCAGVGHGILEADMSVGDHAFRGHLDTGSPNGISIPGSLADKLTFSSPPEVVGHGRTVDATFEIRSAPCQGTVTVAGINFVDPRLTIIDNLPTINVGTAALIGTRLTVDGPAQRLLLEVAPGTDVSKLLNESLAKGNAPQAAGSGPALGVMVVPGINGLTVDQVKAGSRAEKCGLVPGDIITAIDGVKVSEIPPQELRARLGRSGARFTVTRGSEMVTLTVQ